MSCSTSNCTKGCNGAKETRGRFSSPFQPLFHSHTFILTLFRYITILYTSMHHPNLSFLPSQGKDSVGNGRVMRQSESTLPHSGARIGDLEGPCQISMNIFSFARFWMWVEPYMKRTKGMVFNWELGKEPRRNSDNKQRGLWKWQPPCGFACRWESSHPPHLLHHEEGFKRYLPL